MHDKTLVAIPLIVLILGLIAIGIIIEPNINNYNIHGLGVYEDQFITQDYFSGEKIILTKNNNKIDLKFNKKNTFIYKKAYFINSDDEWEEIELNSNNTETGSWSSSWIKENATGTINISSDTSATIFYCEQFNINELINNPIYAALNTGQKTLIINEFDNEYQYICGLKRIGATITKNKWLIGTITECTDEDNDGYNTTTNCGIIDCDDNNASIHPGATEICGDGIDQDCDGNDLACGTEICNGIDDDNNGIIDDNHICNQDFYCDEDKDIEFSETKITCTNYSCITEYSDTNKHQCTTNQGTDCNDNNNAINTNANEICTDNIDNDCDTLIDNNDPDCTITACTLTCIQDNNCNYACNQNNATGGTCNKDPDCCMSDSECTGTKPKCNIETHNCEALPTNLPLGSICDPANNNCAYPLGCYPVNNKYYCQAVDCRQTTDLNNNYCDDDTAYNCEQTYGDYYEWTNVWCGASKKICKEEATDAICICEHGDCVGNAERCIEGNTYFCNDYHNTGSCWELNTVCKENEICTEYTDTMPVANCCENQCELGETQCNADNTGTQICTSCNLANYETVCDKGTIGCNVWQDDKTCNTGEQCYDGECTNTCKYTLDNIPLYDPEESYDCLKAWGYFDNRPECNIPIETCSGDECKKLINMYDGDSSYTYLPSSGISRGYGMKSLIYKLRWAAKKTACLTQDWNYGTSQTQIGDISVIEDDHGITPDANMFSVRHPGDSHDYGRSGDFYYFKYDNDFSQTNCPACTGYNVCEVNYLSGDDSSYVCSGEPYELDSWRNALFLSLLKEKGINRFTSDVKIIPYLSTAITKLHDEGLTTTTAVTFSSYTYHTHHVHITTTPIKECGGNSYNCDGVNLNYCDYTFHSADFSYITSTQESNGINNYCPENIISAPNDKIYYGYDYKSMSWGSPYTNQKRLVSKDNFLNNFYYCQDYRYKGDTYYINSEGELIKGSKENDHLCGVKFNQCDTIGDIRCDGTSLQQCVNTHHSTGYQRWADSEYILGTSCKNNDATNYIDCNGKGYVCIKLEGEEDFHWRLFNQMEDPKNIIPCTTFEYPYEDSGTKLIGYFKYDAQTISDPNNRYVLSSTFDSQCRSYRQNVLKLG